MDSSTAYRPRDFIDEIYSRGSGPSVGTVDLAKLEEQAKEKLKEYGGAFAYAGGAAGSASTHAANRAAFNKWKIIPRMLRNTTNRDLSVTLFNQTYPFPIMLGPVGVQGLYHPEAELASARAAAKFKIPFSLSQAASRSIEEVAEANGEGGHRWAQLYWPKSDDLTLSILSRFKSSGYKVLIVTLDTILLGFRPEDLDAGYLPFKHGIGCAVGLSDPVFMSRYNLPPSHTHHPFPYYPHKLDEIAMKPDKEGEEMRKHMKMSLEFTREGTNGMFRTWEDFAFVRKNWEGPILMKGIMSVKDARKAIEVGADGIVVSNHGGRQVDGAISTIHALERICNDSVIREAQSQGKFTILFDSGIRSGSDIIKAIALGAQAVLIARTYIYGLSMNGQQGVEDVIRTYLADLDLAMALSGHSSIKELHGLARDDKLEEEFFIKE